MKEPSENSPAENVRVPLFGTWRKAYIAVAIAFVAEVSLFYFVSRFFS